MEFLQPRSWDEALAVKAAQPEALPIAGGTDVMVELNFDRRRPAALLDLTRVPELRLGRATGGCGSAAGVTYAELTGELTRHGASGRARAAAARAGDGGADGRARRRSATGARSAATSARPRRPATATRRCWPPGAQVEVASVRGARRDPDRRVLHRGQAERAGPRRADRGRLDQPAGRPEQFAKIGTRNAMVIAVAAFALALHPDRRRGRHRDRLGGADAGAGRRGRGVSRRGAGRGRAVGVAAPRCPSRW